MKPRTMFSAKAKKVRAANVSQTIGPTIQT